MNTLLLAGAAFVGAVSIPLILKRVPPNPVYGFRTPKTLSDPVLWYRVNAFAGWALLIGAIASALLLMGVPAGIVPAAIPEIALFALPTTLGVIASFIYLGRLTREG